MKTILIIEDNNDIRESTAEILGLSGYKVIQADNGKAGVDLAFHHTPDLILCDIMMPELDGYGVLYMLSKNPRTYAIPFIFLTAKAERTDFRRGMDMGADDYLTKPFDDMELLSAIESRFHKKQKHEAYYSRSLESLEHLVDKSGKGLAELQKLIASRRIRQIKKKQVLFYDGDMPQGLYLVLEGSVKTFKIAQDGRELITGMHRNENYLGLDALLLDEPYTETAEAIEDTALCILPKELINTLIDKYPEVSNQFFRILANNIREKEEKLLELAYHSVRKRMAQVLLRLSKQSAHPEHFKVSREELAALAGIATETVSRTLTDFKDEGLINKKGSQIQIINSGKLQNLKN